MVSSHYTCVFKVVRSLVASFVTYSNSPLHPLNQTVLFSCSPSFVLLFIVWDLHIKSDIENVENVQRFVQRICSKKWHSNYDRNLQIFNLFLLSICKVIYKIFVFSDLWRVSLFFQIVLSHLRLLLRDHQGTTTLTISQFLFSISCYFPYNHSFHHILPCVTLCYMWLNHVVNYYLLNQC